MIGKGFGVKLDTNGLATLQTDNLLVLGQMIVQSLTIREVSYIGGSYMLTPAASQAVMVQPLYTTIPYAPGTRYWTPNGQWRCGWFTACCGWLTMAAWAP